MLGIERYHTPGYPTAQLFRNNAPSGPCASPATAQCTAVAVTVAGRKVRKWGDVYAYAKGDILFYFFGPDDAGAAKLLALLP